MKLPKIKTWPIISLNAQTFFKFFSLGIFTFFFILSLRFVIVYLLAMSTPMGLAGLAALLSAGLFAWFFPGYSLLLLVAFSPLAVGATSILGLEAAPVVEFGFCAVFIPWYIKRVIGQRVSLVPQSNVEFLVDFLAAVVVLSLIYQLLQYPFDFVVIRIQYPALAGLIDPFWPLEGSVIFLMGLLLFRILLIEFDGEERFGFFVLLVIVVQTSVLIGFSGYDILNNIMSGRQFDNIRPVLPFTNVNSVAHYATFLFFFWLSIFLKKLSTIRLVNFLILLITISNFFIIIATQSRTALIVLIILGLVLFFSIISAKKKKYFVSIIIVGLFTLNFFSEDISNSNNRYINRLAIIFIVEDLPSNKSLEFRGALWGNALNVAREHLLTGSGIGSYFRISSYYQSHEQQEIISRSGTIRALGNRENAHNYYLQIFAELGLVGFLVFSSILFSAFLAFLYFRKTDRESTRFMVTGSLMTGVVALLLTGFTDHSLLLPAHYVMFWFALSTTVVFNRQKQSKLILWKHKKYFMGFFSIVLITVLFSYGNKLDRNYPDFAEWGFHGYPERIDGFYLRWVMPDSFTETMAKSDKFSITFYADPDKVEQEVIKADIFFYDQHVDQVAWEKEEVILRCYDVPGISGEVLKVRIKSSQSYNPYKQGFSDDLRQSRLQSLAVSDVQFFRIPLSEDKYQCQTINLNFQ